MKTRPYKQATLSPDKINIVTLGCSKNLVDSENLLTQLRAGALDVTHESERADAGIVVINTCGFIDRAKEESVNTILEYAERKRMGRVNQVFVTGCLSERYRDDLRVELPEIDGFFGTQDMPDLVARLGADYRKELLGERITTTQSHFAYLKIAEGCNRPCGFCAIPLMRGKHTSRPIEALVAEARWLVSRGVKEIMLIAQELTFYGIDLYGERRLKELLQALAGIEGLHWLRLHYAYPAGFPVEILPVIAAEPKICNYLDLPLQHIADGVLQRMRRGITRAKTEALLERIRSEVPGIALRTTMLVGYPGETEADFQELLDFVRQARFDRLGVFTYSHEEQTHAYSFMDDVPAEVKEARAAELMAVQQDVSYQLNQARVGRQLMVLIDRIETEPTGSTTYIGRTEYDSPEVDNEVLVTSATPLQIGEFYTVEILQAGDFDLLGRVGD